MSDALRITIAPAGPVRWRWSVLTADRSQGIAGLALTEDAAALAVHEAQQEIRQWTLRDDRPGPSYAASVGC